MLEIGIQAAVEVYHRVLQAHNHKIKEFDDFNVKMGKVICLSALAFVLLLISTVTPLLIIIQNVVFMTEYSNLKALRFTLIAISSIEL